MYKLRLSTSKDLLTWKSRISKGNCRRKPRIRP